MGKGTTTTKTENKPPAWATPLFKQSANEASHLFNSGVGGNTYTGSTVAGLSDTTMQGVNQLAQAGANTNTAGTRPIYQGIGQAAVSDPYVNMLTGVAGRANAGTTQSQNVNTSGIQGGATNVSGIEAHNVGTGGYNPAQSAATGIGSMADKLLSGIAGGQQGINTEADYRGILERAQQQTSAAANLGGYASGEYLKGEGNPFYRQRLEKEIADSNALINSQFSGAGRYGSAGAHQGVIADNTSDMLFRGLEEDFNRQTQNQFNAVGMIDAANQGALGTQLGAASGITGVQGQNIGNRLNASGQMIGAQSDMAGQLKGIADSRAGIETGNANRSLDAGIARAGFSEADMARALQASTSRAGFEAGNADRSLQSQTGNMDRALTATGLQGNLLSQAAGLRGQGLDRAQTAANSMAGLDQQQFQNRLTGAGATLQAGGLMDQQAQRQLSDEVAKWYAQDNQDWTRLGLLQSAAAGSAGNYGTQVSQSRQPMDIGGIMSGFGSLLGKSDARLKENIAPIGYRNGHILWEFTYKGSPGRFVGVMAQFVMDTQPEAVVVEPDGFYAVNYAALGFPMEKI